MNEARTGTGSRSAYRSALVLTRSRFVRAFPSASEIVFGTPVWGLAMVVSAWFALVLRESALTFHLVELLVMYGIGGMLAWPLAVFLARFATLGRPGETRFAAYLLCLSLGTIAFTALLFALDYRVFYARWHAHTGTRTWFYQFGFTSLVAFYQFLVLGVRLYLPFGGAVLVAASLWLARSEGRQQR
ncbi:hypothetical protein [Ensifer sp.]|uniref:hypothetical protein n=1 Tax=Ensifer sp. TaxID=1872086 RepID=UPI00289E74BC|nr:hypothetical protein [Ensifer sp.]